MNNLKIEKPLIEWEKELDIWLVDINFSDHFINYNKIDAFDRINVLRFKRGWDNTQYDIYNDYLSKQFSDCLVMNEFKYNNVFETNLYEEKPLIEWERERGIWISNLCFADHVRLYNKKDAFNMLRKPTIMWNDESERVYLKFLNKNLDNKRDVVTENLQVKKVKKNINNMKNFKDKFAIINSKKNRNVKFMKKNILKKSIAIMMGITATLSAFVYSNFETVKGYKENVSDDFSYINLDGTDTNNIDFDSYLFNGLVSNKDVSVDFSNNSDFGQNLTNKSDKDLSKCDIIRCNSDYSSHCDIKVVDDDILDLNNVLNIGTEVAIKNDSEIYENCIDAMNDVNGMEPYYSSDYSRVINGVCLKYDDNILYLSNGDEINNYINDGASVVSYSTMVDNGICEGFYCADDIKVLTKQI